MPERKTQNMSSRTASAAAATAVARSGRNLACESFPLQVDATTRFLTHRLHKSHYHQGPRLVGGDLR